MDKTIRIAAASLITLAAAAPAQSGGFQLNERSTKALGASLSGATSAASDVTFTAFNPAALATVEGIEIGGSANLVMPIAEGTVALTGDTVDADQDALVPSFAAGYRIDEDVVIGVATYSPFGLVTDYEEDFIGRLDAETSRLTAVVIAPTLGWNVTDNFMLGGSFNVIYADARLTNAAVELKGDKIDVGFSVGALYRPTETTTLGASYHSGYDLTLEGTNTINALPGMPTFSTLAADASLPDWASIGVTQEIGPRFRLMAEGRWIGWSDFHQLDISTPGAPDLSAIGGPNFSRLVEVQDYEDSYFFALGGEYDVTNRITLRSGIAYDDTPTTDEARTPRVPDEDRLWLSIGGSYKLNDRMSLDASYSYLHALDDAVVNLDSVPTSVEYDGGAHIVSIGGSIKF